MKHSPWKLRISWESYFLKWYCTAKLTYLIYLLTSLLHGAESFFRSKSVLSKSRNSPHFVEPKSSLPHSQVLPPVHILSQTEPVHATTSHFLKIHLNIILPSMPGSSKWSLSPQVLPQKPCIHLSSPPYVLHAPPITFFSIWSHE